MKADSSHKQQLATSTQIANWISLQQVALILVCIIGLTLFFTYTHAKEQREEASRHAKLSLKLVQDALLESHTEPETWRYIDLQRPSIQELLDHLANDLDTRVYLYVDDEQRLAPSSSVRKEEYSAVDLSRNAIIELQMGATSAYYTNNNTPRYLLAQALSNDLLLVADVPQPSWRERFGAPIYVLLTCGFILTLFIRRSGRRLSRLWRKQSVAQAMIDPLTMVPSRYGFSLLSKAYFPPNAAASLPIGILVVNVQQFNQFNQRYSPAFADKILQAIAQWLTQQVDSQHLLCRWNGDEFLILLQDCEAEEAQIRAQYILHHFNHSPLVIDDIQLKVDVQIGGCCGYAHHSAASLVLGANEALQMAKVQQSEFILHHCGN